MKLAWSLGILGACLAACSTSYEMDKAEPCRQAGYSIAARTQSCSGDSDLANTRYERFADSYRCLVKDARYYDFQCAVDLFAVDCTKAGGFADDLDQWLSNSKSCSLVLVHADGTPVGVATVETPSVNYQCSKAVEAMMQRVGNCGGQPNPTTFLEDVDARYKCLVPSDPTQPYLEEVKRCAACVNFPCSNGSGSFDAIWSTYGDCQAVIGKRSP